MMQLFKVLDKDGKTYRGYQYDPLPAPGVELPALKSAVLCESGYHAAVDPTKWRGTILYEDVRIWLVELGGDVVADREKVAATGMRWMWEVDDTWPFLPLFPAVKAMLMARWRAKHAEGDWPDWADLAGAYLAGAYLAGADLAGADLAGANLADAYLAGANLTGANLTGANLARANLAGADLAGANLADAYLAGADLAGAYLAGAYLAGAYLAGANLADANLTRADLAGANLADANLADANLTRADLADAYLGDWERGDDGFARLKPEAPA